MRIRTAAMVFAVLLASTACDLMTGPSSECNKDNAIPAADHFVDLRLDLSQGSWRVGDQTYYAVGATSAVASGTITKYYCSGKQSGSFAFESTMVPGLRPGDSNNFKIGQTYQFKFENVDDSLLVLYRVKLYYGELDGNAIIETTEISRRFHPTDLTLNLDTLMQEAKLDLQGTGAVQVTR